MCACKKNCFEKLLTASKIAFSSFAGRVPDKWSTDKFIGDHLGLNNIENIIQLYFLCVCIILPNKRDKCYFLEVWTTLIEYRIPYKFPPPFRPASLISCFPTRVCRKFVFVRKQFQEFVSTSASEQIVGFLILHFRQKIQLALCFSDL